ncbi:hypothetical protein [Streptomyces asiaticus]
MSSQPPTPTPPSPDPDPSPDPSPSPDPAPSPTPDPPDGASPPSSSRRWYRNPTIIAALVPTLVFGGCSAYQGWRNNASSDRSADAGEAANRREDQKDKEKQQVADGPPVKVTPGEPPILPTAFAFANQTHDVSKIANVSDWDGTFNNWMREHGARPVGLYAVRFTVKALKDDTTILQDFRLKDRKCDHEVAATIDDVKRNRHGTLVYPPALGGSGAEVKRDVLGFQVSQYDETTARVMKRGYPKLGAVRAGTDTEVFLRQRFSTKTITMEQNDARTFDVYFASELDCSFGLEMNVTVGGEDTWVSIPVAAAWDKGERASIAGPEEPYDTLVRPKADGSGMELGNPMREGGVPKVSIMADDVTP